MGQNIRGQTMAKRDAGTVSERGLAAEILGHWLGTGAFPDRLLGPSFPHRGFVMEVVYGAVKYCRALDWIIACIAPRRPDDVLHGLLLAALYELFYMRAGPPYAVVHESVDLAKAMGSGARAAFVNAVLRTTLREAETLRHKLALQPLGVRKSHPETLLQRWHRLFGAEQTEALCRWNNQPAEVIVRINRHRTSVDDFVARLATEGIGAKRHPFAPNRMVVLPRGVAVDKVPGYKEGMFFVQDPSTLLAVDLLAPEPGERLLDACAAPGGKAVAVAEQMEGRGELVAADLHEDRLGLLRDNARRAGLKNLVVVQADARRRDAASLLDEGRLFDGILLDVPCTNTGVLRRRPDARWRFAAARLRQMTEQQRAFLDAAAPRLRAGGRLVYSTCSLEEEENQQMVRAWLAGHADFMLEEERCTFPPSDGVDGAYAVRLRKRRG